MLDGYEITLISLECLFVICCCIYCYGTEIRIRTPWAHLRLGYFIHSLAQKRRARKSKGILPGLQREESQKTQPVREITADDRKNNSNMSAAETGTTSPPRKGFSRRLCRAPLCLWILAIAPAFAELFGNPNKTGAALLGGAMDPTELTDLKLNADICGVGVRVGLYLPIGLILYTISLGLIWREEGGAKELGGAQLLSLLYLTFNAIKASATRPQFSNLKFGELVIACICIDITAAGLQMTTSDKGTLSARTFVQLSALLQSVAMLMMVIMLANVKHSYDDVPHTYMIWWGRIDSRTGPSESTWLYVVLRCLMLLHNIWLDLMHAPIFDMFKKDWDALAPADQELEMKKKKATDEGGAPLFSDFEWVSLSATVFSKWVEWLPTIVVGIASIETVSKRLPKPGEITDWGQSAALVIAIAGALHWLYVVQSPINALQERSPSGEYEGPKGYDTDFPRYHANWTPNFGRWDDMLVLNANLGTMKYVRRALKHRANVDHVDGQGKTALLYAISHSKYDRCELFDIIMRYYPHPAMEGTEHAIFVAAKSGNAETVDRLLERYPDVWPWQKQDGYTALALAAEAGNEESLKRLLNAWTTSPESPSHFQENNNSKTPLMAALLKPQWPCAKILLDDLIKSREYDRISNIVSDLFFGLEIIRPAFLLPGSGKMEKQTSFIFQHLLEPDGHIKGESKTLLHHIAQGEDIWCIMPSIASLYISHKYSLDGVDEDGCTALLLATETRRLDHIDALLQFNADAFKKDHQGRSAFSLLMEVDDVKSITGIFKISHEAKFMNRILDNLGSLAPDIYTWLCSRDIISPIQPHLVFEKYGVKGYEYLLEFAVNRNNKVLVKVLTSELKPFDYDRNTGLYNPLGYRYRPELVDWRALAADILGAVESWDEFYGRSDTKAYDVLRTALEEHDDGVPSKLEVARKQLQNKLGPSP